MTLGAHYRILGLAAGATADEIRAAYRRKARILHPDVSDTGSEAAFIELTRAYRAVLADHERKRSRSAAAPLDPTAHVDQTLHRSSWGSAAEEATDLSGAARCPTCHGRGGLPGVVCLTCHRSLRGGPRQRPGPAAHIVARSPYGRLLFLRIMLKHL